MRDRAGKGGARSSRRDGLIPAVIYGDKQPPMMIAVEPKIDRARAAQGGLLQSPASRSTSRAQGYDVLPRDVQVDPVTDKPLHLDFLRIGPDSIITVQVPVHFKNEAASPGIKRGGVLNIVLHEITVRTKPDTIPELFEVDLTGLEIGHSIHLSALNVPEGVRVVTRDKNADRGLDRRADRGARSGGRGGGSAATAAPAAVRRPRRVRRLRQRRQLRRPAAKAPAPAKK